jgi:hypothetical protein
LQGDCAIRGPQQASNLRGATLSDSAATPEKDDMGLPAKGSRGETDMKRKAATIQTSPLERRLQAPQSAPRVRLVQPVARLAEHRTARGRVAAPQPQLRCVASGYTSEGGSCHTHIPASVVIGAWARQRRRGTAGEGFFHFSWRGEIWLGYGLADGAVRGVYCPTHAAQRDERSARSSVAALPPAAPRPSAISRGA